MSAEAIKKAQESSDESKTAQEEACEKLGKVIESGHEVASNYTKAVSNLPLHTSEIISASYSPRNL